MTSDDRLEQHLARGLADLAGSGPPRYGDEILARTFRTRQRPARTPFRRSRLPLGMPTRPRGMATGRLLPMTPTIRYAAVAGLALALGLVVAPLIGGSVPTPLVAAPGSEAGGSAVPDTATWVTGTIRLADSCVGPAIVIRKGVGIEYRDYRCEPQAWTASDPRLTAAVTVTWNSDTHSSDPGDVTVNVGTAELTNEGGTWLCTSTPSFARRAGGLEIPDRSSCVGRGDYEGQTAIIEVDSSATPPTFEGIILTGQLPPTP